VLHIWIIDDCSGTVAFMPVRMSDAKALGAAIRTQRLSLGWTQAGLAERAQVSRRFVGELEAGHRTGAELGRVFAVLRALRVAVILVDSGPPSFDDALREVLG
jgi:HTH-type transcriptional regulator/antitoxin HipB